MQEELDKLYTYEDSLKSIFDEIVLIPVIKDQTEKVKQIDTIIILLEDLIIYTKEVKTSAWDKFLLEDICYCLACFKVLQDPLFETRFEYYLNTIYAILYNRFSPISSMQDFIKSMLNSLKKATKINS